MAKQIIVPFADSGDREAIPDSTQPSGSVSWEEGWGPDYSRIPGSSPLAKKIDRKHFNQSIYDLSTVAQQFQQYGAPEWYDDTMYAQYARVQHNGSYWVNAVAGNLTEPGVSGTWVRDNIPAPNRQNNLTATTDPTASDDSSEGYEPLSAWINTATSEVFTCISAAIGAAVWQQGTLTPDELGNMALVNGSIVGQNLVQIPDGAAIGFVRINADNSVSKLGAADFRTAQGLGTAAVANVTTSTTDPVAGKVLRVADFGIGVSNTPQVTDAQTMLGSGFYGGVGGAGVNFPTTGTQYGTVLVTRRNASTQFGIHQGMLTGITPDMWLKATNDAGVTWGQTQVLTAANQLPLGTTPESARAAIDSSVLPAYTVATVPNASANPNKLIVVTNAAAGRNSYLSDGTNWRDPARVILS